MLKKGDVFRQEGNMNLLVAITDTYPNGSVLTIYEDKQYKKTIYAGININDYAVEIYGNVSKLITETNSAKLDIDKIMKQVKKRRMTWL